MKHCRDRNTHILRAYILNSINIGIHTLLYVHLTNLLYENSVHYHHFLNQVSFVTKAKHNTWKKSITKRDDYDDFVNLENLSARFSKMLILVALRIYVQRGELSMRTMLVFELYCVNLSKEKEWKTES